VHTAQKWVKGLGLIKDVRESIELSGTDIAFEFDSKEEFQFQCVHFFACNPTNARVVFVVEEHIITVLGSEQQTCQKQTMDRARVDKQSTLNGCDAIQINQTHNKGLNGARGIGNDSLHILTKCDTW